MYRQFDYAELIQDSFYEMINIFQDEQVQIGAHLLQPTQQEIKESIKQIQKRFYHLDIQKLISKLYFLMKNSIKDNPNKEKNETNLLKQPHQDNQPSFQQLIQLNAECNKNSTNFNPFQRNKNSEMRLIYQRIILTNKITICNNEHEQVNSKNILDTKGYRYLTRYLGAKSFCKKGYGIQHMRNQIIQDRINMIIDDKTYKCVACSFITDAFRKLQTFLIEDCKKNISTISCDQIKMLYSILFHLSNKCPKNEALTFIKFIKLIYNIEEVFITEEQSVNLYTRLMLSLQQKIRLKYCKVNDRPLHFKLSKTVNIDKNHMNLDKLWTKQRELQFYNSFLREGNLNKVCNYYRHKYFPKLVDMDGHLLNYNSEDIKTSFNQHKTLRFSFPNQEAFLLFRSITDFNNLKNKFRKTILRGLRRIQAFVQMHANSIPKLKTINNNVINILFCSDSGIEVRKAIFQLQKKDDFDVNTIVDAVILINQFLSKAQMEQKMQIQSEHELEKIPYF